MERCSCTQNIFFPAGLRSKAFYFSAVGSSFSRRAGLAIGKIVWSSGGDGAPHFSHFCSMVNPTAVFDPSILVVSRNCTRWGRALDLLSLAAAFWAGANAGHPLHHGNIGGLLVCVDKQFARIKWLFSLCRPC